MTDGTQQALHDQLRALNEQFAKRLDTELAELGQRPERLSNAREQEQRRQRMLDLHERLHRLAGSAGTFGFTAFGEQARVLEQRAERWLEAARPSGQALSEFIQAVQHLASATQAGEPQQTLAEPSAIADSRPASCRIYLLESDIEAGQEMCRTLDNFGYEMLLFPDIALLQAAVQGQLPDALVISQHAAELEAVSALQQSLEVPLPLLVIGHQADFDSQLAAVRAGAKGYFTRPLDVTQLENTLENCLNLQLSEPYRVLIVDDDADLASRYSLVLRNSQMLVQTLTDPSQLFEVMRAFNPEVVLLDMNMPDFTGLELAQMIRLNDEWLRVTIIYLSGETDINRQMDALLKAGDDFITKPISDSALTAAVFSQVQRARALSMALSRDSLTGLLKHADIKEQVTLEVERSLRSGNPASVVNDRYGHAAGDNVIRALANLMRQRLRRIDSIGRYGGEEFVAVLPDCPAEQAKRIFDEIREHFAALSFHAGGRTFSVSLSAGVSQTDGQASGGELLERADQCLYLAKGQGRNRVMVAAQS